jgi:hypothetical protein
MNKLGSFGILITVLGLLLLVYFGLSVIITNQGITIQCNYYNTALTDVTAHDAICPNYLGPGQLILPLIISIIGLIIALFGILTERRRY